MKTLKELVRPNIWNLKPYSSARDEFHGEATVFIDANENPYTSPFNRYPDPMQWTLKQRISELKGVGVKHIFLGNGSDEPIDLIIRAFCEPGVDNILSIAPSYGMYQVSADVNNVEFRTVLLNKHFDLDADALLATVNEHTKVVFLCSPNNPTGNSLSRKEVYKVLDGFEGIVVMDEAYIDFSMQPSYTEELAKYPNLVILQTLSKAWGGAGLRLGMAFASQEIVGVLSKIKYPYNINQLTQEAALALLNQTEKKTKEVRKIMEERSLLESAIVSLPFVLDVYPTDANFILVKVTDANAIYDYLVTKGIIVRNRHNIVLCEDCLRITIGTLKENNALLKALSKMEL